MPIITVFGGLYCHADEIAAGVSEQLGIPVLNESIIEETVKRFDIDPDKLTRALYGPDPLLNKVTHERQKNLAALKIVLSEMIQQDNLILRHCLGHLIPKTISHVLRVCLIANTDYRIEVGCRETGESDRKVARLLSDDDKRQHQCTEYLFGQMAFSEKLYDMLIAVHDTPVAKAIQSICEYAASDAIKTTSHSTRAAHDFILSARVESELVKDGYQVEVHSEDGRVILSINENVVRWESLRKKLADAAMKVEGVKEVVTQRGPKYKMESVNPWSNVDTPPHFMLVDDEKDFVNTLSERLKTRNLESSIAYDGEQALEMVQASKPDVMVLDLMMPGIDGLEVLRRLKLDHPEVQVIILTGHGSDKEKQQAEELGAFAYLRKPVNVDVLAQVMRDAYEACKKNDSNSSGDG